jgi:putative ABC transport system permease protein
VLAPGQKPAPSDASASTAAANLALDFPDVEAITRLARSSRWVGRDQANTWERVAWTDPDFFKVLPYPVLAGDPIAALHDPGGLVLTRKMARKYFGVDAPIGETLLVQAPSGDAPLFATPHPMRVRAVLQDVPRRTHLEQFEIFASGRAAWSPLALEDQRPGPGLFFWTYARLPPGMSADRVRDGLEAFAARRYPGPLGRRFRLEPLKDLHFTADAHAINGAIAIVAVLIVVIAAINFVTLMTARAVRRAIEVGVRKAIGARRRDLIVQFMGEALIYVLAAMLIGVLIVGLTLPAVNAFLDRSIAFDYLEDPALTAAIVGAAVLSGLMAGVYPAVMLSSFPPAAALKGRGGQRSGSAAVRHGLVVVQFAVLTALIIVTATIYRQTSFALQNVLRLNQDQIVYTDCEPGFKEKLAALPGVMRSPASLDQALGFPSKTFVKDPARGNITVDTAGADVGLFEMHGLKPLAGRFFSNDRGEDMALEGPDTDPQSQPSLVLNESAVRRLGLSSPQDAIGKSIDWVRPYAAPATGDSPFRSSRIVGVVSDFTLTSIRTAVAPTMYYVDPISTFHLFAKLEGQRLPETLQAINALWRSTGQVRPIKLDFLGETMREQYRDVQLQGGIIGASAGLAIVIACLGLFALAAFTAERRTKEIGVRKAMGASRFDVVRSCSGSSPSRCCGRTSWPGRWPTGRRRIAERFRLPGEPTALAVRVCINRRRADRLASVAARRGRLPVPSRQPRFSASEGLDYSASASGDDTHARSPSLRRCADFRKSPFVALANVTVLALGLTAFVATYAVTDFWNGAERQFANSQRIFVISSRIEASDGSVVLEKIPATNPYIAKHLPTYVPRIEAVARARSLGFGDGVPVSAGDRAARLFAVAADAEFLEIFDLFFIASDPRTALARPRSVVLTESAAERLFGAVSPLGLTVSLSNRVDATVTGVAKAIAEPSHLARSAAASMKFDMLASMDLHAAYWGATPDGGPENWFGIDSSTYVLLPSDASVTAGDLQAGVEAIVGRHMPAEQAAFGSLLLEVLPVTRILGLNASDVFLGGRGSITTVLWLLGSLVLGVACVNYAGLAAARAAGRAHEVGVRKAIGANARDVLVQHLLEAGLLTSAALALAVLFVRALSPIAETSFGIDLTSAVSAEPRFLAFIAAVATAVTLLAGAYPAFVLSRVRPIFALRAFRQRAGRKVLLSVLVGIQFAAASFLSIAVAVIYLQNGELRRTGLGIATDPLLVIENRRELTGLSADTLRNELLRLPQVLAVAATDRPPFQTGGIPLARSADDGAPQKMVPEFVVSHDFASVLELGLLAGHFFERERADAARNRPGIVIDRAVAEFFGFPAPADAVDQTLYVPKDFVAMGPGTDAQPLQVIGVVENKPLAFSGGAHEGYVYWLGAERSFSFTIARLSRDDVAGALEEIDELWRRLAPGIAVSRRFVDEIFEAEYAQFARIADAITALCSFAVLIAIVGLFAMAQVVVSSALTRSPCARFSERRLP